MTRDQFFLALRDLRNKSQRGLVILQKSDNLLEKNIKDLIREKGVNFHDEFKKCRSVNVIKPHGLVPEDVNVTREDFKNLIN